MRYASYIRPHSRGLTLAAALLVLGACSSGTEPSTGPLLTKAGGDDQFGSINEPLSQPLSVRVTNGAGQPIAGVTVTWMVTSGGGSVSPAISETDGNGTASTTWTLGPAAGQQSVTASVAGGPSVVFTADGSSVPACGSPVTLAVGEVCLASAAQVHSLPVGGGATGGEFVAIPFHDGNLSRSPVAVDAVATGAIGVTGPPTPVVIPSFESIGALGEIRLPDHGFERQLRRRERAALAPRVGSGRARRSETDAASLSLTPAPPRFAVGDQLTLNANANDACGVNQQFMKPSVVRWESATAIIVEDLQNPAGGFTDADYAEIAANFESLVRPTVVGAFGTHTDIDGNSRIIIFYTIEVNRLTAPGSTSFVGGFFFSRDLFPKTQTTTTPTGKSLSPCAGSNFAEMFYMLAPDPQGCFTSVPGQCSMQNVRSIDFVKRTTAGTIAHEYQHLINASRRLYITPAAIFPEAVWLDEGLAHIAEELAYYRATGFAPRQNLNVDQIRGSQTLIDHVNTYLLANLSRYSSYLRRTPAQSPYGETPTPPAGSSPPADWDDLETRGAIWNFLRWAADHRGGDDGDTWQRLVRDATATGIDNLRAVFGAQMGPRFRQWAGANYMDDAFGALQPDPVFRHPSWNFRSILPALSTNNNAYPLAVGVIANAGSGFNLVDGGAAYLRFGVAANGTATLQVRSAGGGQLPAGVATWVARTK